MSDVIEDFNYIPSPTGMLFHNEDAIVKGVIGAFGSGKTCMVIRDALYYAMAQNPAPDGVRYTRIGVLRTTYPELKSTTRNSLLEILPKEFGSISSGGFPMTGLYKFPLGDGSYEWVENGTAWEKGLGTFVHMELVLQAIQTEDDVEKLRSANWSFAIINEASTFDFGIITAVLGRVGRYPSQDMGGCSYSGILFDSNQPPQGHFLLNPPDSWVIFRQPPACFKHIDEAKNITYEINPEAENLRNLGTKNLTEEFYTWSKVEQDNYLKETGMQYYRDQIEAYVSDGRYDMVDNLFCMLDTPIKSGILVWTEFDPVVHIAKHKIDSDRNKYTVVGYDTSGIHPAVVFIQRHGDTWVVTDELYGDEIGMESFIDLPLLTLVHQKYNINNILISCDPSDPRNALNMMTPSGLLRSKGFNVRLAPTNDIKSRIQVVANLFNKRLGGLLISPHCVLLCDALRSGYVYKKLRVIGSNGVVYDNKPDKNSRASHICDALQYGVLSLIGTTDNRGSMLVKKLANKTSKVGWV